MLQCLLLLAAHVLTYQEASWDMAQGTTSTTCCSVSSHDVCSSQGIRPAHHVDCTGTAAQGTHFMEMGTGPLRRRASRATASAYLDADKAAGVSVSPCWATTCSAAVHQGPRLWCLPCSSGGRT